jgi:RHS repeat-associated protein
MNSISTTSSIKNGIPAGSAVLWARGVFDATGKLVESLSYDPWGRRRNPTNWSHYNISSTLFDRGFTGHEHLPQFGLINMNGRVYDPFLARFLSPDPPCWPPCWRGFAIRANQVCLAISLAIIQQTHAGADLQSVPIKYVWQFLWQLSSKHLT